MYANYHLPDSSVMSWLGHVDGELAYEMYYLSLTWMQKLYKHQLVVTKYGRLLLGSKQRMPWCLCIRKNSMVSSSWTDTKFKMEINFKNLQSNWLYLLWACYSAHLLCADINPILTEVFQKLNTLAVTTKHIILSILTDVSWWNNVFWCIRSTSVDQ